MAAVADGAGSARHSGVAARVASQCAVEWIVSQQEALPSNSADQGWRALFDGAMAAAAKAVQLESQRQNIPLSELATTLIIVVATPDFSAAAQIGDGAVIVSDLEGNLFALTVPQRGEYRNDTIFLNSKNALEQSGVYLWPGSASHLSIFTDGLELLALNLRDGMPHGPFFDPLWKFSKGELDEGSANSQLAAFLASPRIASRTDDDLTLVLGYLKEETK